MKKLVIAGALALALSGCAKLITTLSSPQATQAANNVKAFTEGFVCGLGSLSALATTVEAQLQAQMKVGNAMVTTDTGIVYVISAGICTGLGGKIASTTPVAVPATATAAPGVLQ